MSFILFMSPVIQLVLFGYVVTTDIKNIPVLIIDHDKSALSRELTTSIFATEYFKKILPVENLTTTPERLMQSSKVKVVIVIPPDFSKEIGRNSKIAIEVILDGSDANSATIIKNYLSEIIREYSMKIFENQKQRSKYPKENLLMSVPVILPVVRIWYNPELKSSYYMVPGILCQILLVMTSLLAALAITKEKELGTLEQILVSPLKRWEYVLGKTLPFILIGFIEVLLVLGVARILFGVPVRGSLLLLFLTAILFLFTTLGIGLFVASISKTQAQAMLTVFPIVTPAFLLSGLFFPVSSIPIYLRWIAYINPLTYFMVIVRGILLKGTGFFDIYKEIVVLVIFGIFFILFSSLRFRKRIE